MGESSTDQLPSVENEPAKGRAGMSWVIWALVLIPLLYVLSIGPAARIYPSLRTRSPQAAQALENLYKPLEILADHWKPFERFIRWYIFDLWKLRV